MTEELTTAAPVVVDQLTQVRVPLDDAAIAFSTRDASGRTPIVVQTERQNRVRNDFMLAAVIVLVAGFVAGNLLDSISLPALSVPLAIVLAVLGVWRSFYIIVPEGASALLLKGGKYSKTIGSGRYFMPPWIVVNYLVTRREIPYDAPVLEAPTADNVRAAVDVLVTFMITDPYQFVYSIAADDFDLVLQSACQDALRGLIRRTPLSQISDLQGQTTDDLRLAIDAVVASHGVTIRRVSITAARPPEDFLRSEEARQLAILQRSEQTEVQTLALQRQADEEARERQKVKAHVEREREALQLQVQQAAARKQIAELEAEAAELRLAKQEEMLQRYPHAAQWEWSGTQLEVARALASNSRVILQVQGVEDIARALMMREIAFDPSAPPADGVSEVPPLSGTAS
ncbi:MAG TPA: SPFH domain-containing protein [Roseiflexaceae bacterium]|nr:SPFH domain-containing protein [Roseiflexaceae bacterium]